MQGVGGNCGKRVAFLNSVVGERHTEEMNLDQRSEGGQRWCHAHP